MSRNVERTEIMAVPLIAAELSNKLAGLGAPARIIVAVSGGPDSMALLRLAAQWAAAEGADALAVTIDHGLRPEARAEAETVARWAGATGLEHQILVWEGEKPASGIQAAARAARYRLLAERAEAGGFDAILTGHTADDQAETVFMRLARGAGPAGLAAMRAETLIAAGAGEPVRLLRPLLEFPRARILSTLKALDQDYIDDPSNDDPAYERIRTRALLAALEQQKLLTGEALRRTAARARAAARRIEAMDAARFEQAGGLFHEGWASLEIWKAAPPSLIARLIRTVSGGDFAPGEDDAAAALSTVEAGGAATLGGALVKRHAGRLCIMREPAALFGRAGVAPMAPVTIAPGERVLWDGRFILVNDGPNSARIGPAGADVGLAEETPIEALMTMPVDLDGGRLRAASLLDERFAARVVRFR